MNQFYKSEHFLARQNRYPEKNEKHNNKENVEYKSAPELHQQHRHPLYEVQFAFQLNGPHVKVNIFVSPVPLKNLTPFAHFSISRGGGKNRKNTILFHQFFQQGERVYAPPCLNVRTPMLIGIVYVTFIGLQWIVTTNLHLWQKLFKKCRS